MALLLTERWQFSSFAFASVLASTERKGKCAKLAIAKTGLSNPKKRRQEKTKKLSMICRDVLLSMC